MGEHGSTGVAGSSPVRGHAETSAAVPSPCKTWACGYDVVVTYDLAKVGSRVRIPLAALLKTGQQLFFLHWEHEVSGSNPLVPTMGA